jgi:hypothetical protein
MIYYFGLNDVQTNAGINLYKYYHIELRYLIRPSRNFVLETCKLLRDLDKVWEIC